MAQQTGYENIAPRGPRKQGKQRWSQAAADRCDGESADYSTIARLLVNVRQPGARDIGDCMTHSPERRKEKAEGEGGTASCALVSISGTLEICLNGMAVVSGK